MQGQMIEIPSFEPQGCQQVIFVVVFIWNNSPFLYRLFFMLKNVHDNLNIT